LKVKDSTLYVNDPWQAKDNFVSATDKNGKAVAFNQVKVSGQVNTQSAGKYTITYSYAGKTATATVTVKEKEKEDKTALKLKETSINKYVGDTYDENELRNNIAGLTNKDGIDVFATDKGKVQIIAKDAQHQTVALAALTQKAGTYTVTYSYEGYSIDAIVTVKEDKTTLRLHETSINKYVGDTYGENELRDNITGLTNKDGQDVFTTDKNKVQITAKDAQHQTVALANLTQKAGTYTITYSYGGKTATATVTVKENKTALRLHETSINKYVGDTYGENELRNNISGLTNKDGQDVFATDKNKVQITAKDAQHQNVVLAALTQKVGTYTITYSYEGKTATLTLNTVDPSAPVLSADGQEVQFMNQSWSVLRGPAELGEGNYLVAAQKALKEEVEFNNDGNFFETNDRHAEGYLTSNVKAAMDAWYDDHVKGTAVERYVQPVVLNNPTLGDMIDLGILKSNTEDGDSNNWYLTHEAKYRTRVDESHGVKQAFALSCADVSSGNRNQSYKFTTDLTSEAMAWRDKLVANGLNYTKSNIWLRSPGAFYNNGASINSNYDGVDGNFNYSIPNAAGLVPVLVVHVE
uniref:bacterial Ig-like domain-containing protein n=1 Tax=Lactococcus garvieae TaxID=1363 RepID=UPI00359C632B